MARSRSIPTNLFWDPDFSQLDSETQTILIGLTLAADDEGRGMAHLDILARQLNKPAASIACALEILADLRFVFCYRIERHYYYQHARWEEWEHGLAPNKRAPSRFPAPPLEGEEHLHAPRLSGESQNHAAFPGEIQGFLGNPGENLSQGEDEEKRNEEKQSEAEGLPASSNLLTFPITSATADVDETPSREIAAVTIQVAHILNLAETPALRHIVEEFHQTPGLSLQGEADMAREWIDDRQRNRHGQHMTPAFFRRWLKREQEAIQRRQTLSSSDQTRATGTGDIYPSRSLVTPPRSSPGYRSLMNLEAEYQDAQQRKVAAHD